MANARELIESRVKGKRVPLEEGITAGKLGGILQNLTNSLVLVKEVETDLHLNPDPYLIKSVSDGKKHLEQALLAFKEARMLT